MKKMILLVGIFCLFQFCMAQSSLEIKRIEYFFNKDSGVNTGTILPGVITSDTVIKNNALISVANLPNGIHTMYLRAKNDSAWSQYVGMFFYINQYLVGTEPDISSAEFFFDHDPGIGNATPLSVGIVDTVVTFTKLISIDGISPGVHTIFIRVKNSDGKWSHFQNQMLYVSNDAYDMPAVVSGEYFIDHDPGIDAAQTIKFNFSPSGNIVTQTFSLPVPVGLSIGQHYIYARVKDATGHWSNFQDTFRIITLPVTGLTLTAAKRNRFSLLNWHTLTENNTSQFEIEKSRNGIEFTRLSIIKAKGSSTVRSEYNFTDTTPAPGLNYYRIKQIDNDSKYIYSQIVKLWFDKDAGKLLLYPNPADNILNIDFTSKNESVFINLYDAAGQWIKLFKLPSSNKLKIDLHGIHLGIYTIHVSDGLTNQVGKFIKK